MLSIFLIKNNLTKYIVNKNYFDKWPKFIYKKWYTSLFKKEIQR